MGFSGMASITVGTSSSASVCRAWRSWHVSRRYLWASWAWKPRAYGAREFPKLGHTVKLMSPQCVRPYVQRQNNDPNDAAGIGEAVGRPQMRFVPLKSVEPQDRPALHRIGERQIKSRTAVVHHLRGL